MTVRKIAALALVLAAAAPCLAEKPDNPGKEPRVLLRQQFAPGKYRIVQAVERQQKFILGTDMPPTTVKITIEMTSELAVTKPNASGQKEMTLTFSRMKLSVPGMGFDSTDPESMDKSRLGKVYKPLLKAKIAMVVDKSGKIVSAKGLDAVWDEMVKEDPSMKPFAEKMKGKMGDQTLREMLDSANRMMPPKPVGEGAVWHVKNTQEIPIIGKASVNVECELTGLRKTAAGQIATIQLTSDIKSTGGGGAAMGGMPVKINKVDLKQTGRVILNVETGLASEHTVSQKGQIRMSVGAADQKQEVTSDVQSTVKTTVTPLK